MAINKSELMEFASITDKPAGEKVHFEARVHAVRKISSKFAFLILRQRTKTIQAILTKDVNWKDKIQIESLIEIKGTLTKPPEPIKSTTFSEIEILISDINVISKRLKPLKFNVYQSENSNTKNRIQISNHTKFLNPTIEKRTPTSQAIFKIKAGICNIYRNYLDCEGFIEVQTPKLTGIPSESGASVFKVDYFGRNAFLAQSPQLSKQMCILSDFEKIYEIGPVFRAENSNTNRHLTEFIGLDMEMVLKNNNYDEIIELIDGFFKKLFSKIYKRYRNEIDVIKKQFPHDDLQWLDKTPRISFSDAIDLLNERKSKLDDDENERLSYFDDLKTKDEILLGEIVKEKYKTDYFILDKFPSSVRPFYTMDDNNDSNFTNSFDFILRGQEILSGAQRIHDFHKLTKKMKKRGMSLFKMNEYLEGFQYAPPPHAGTGIGLERLVMQILQLNNIRFASIFHRDPSSFQNREKEMKRELRHPKADTLQMENNNTAGLPKSKKGKQNKIQTNKKSRKRDSLKKISTTLLHHNKQQKANNDHQINVNSNNNNNNNVINQNKQISLEKLIANYGDASNTSWLDDRYKVWRHDITQAAIGYVPSGKHTIVVGNPLCDKSQYSYIIDEFLNWGKKSIHDFHPIWLLVSNEVEEILKSSKKWKSLGCTAEKTS